MDPNKLYRMLLDIFGEEYEVRRGQFRINCFNPECDDDTGNLEISLEKGIFHCWKCDYSGTILRLLKDYTGKVPDVDRYISPVELVNPEKLFFEFEKVKKGVFAGLPKEFNLLEQEPDNLVAKKALKYTLARMDYNDVKEYRIGYCSAGKYRWRIIVPSFENGDPIYFTARTFMNELPTYKNPNKEEIGIGKEEVVFNIDSIQDRAVICEGVFDAIRVGKSGVAIFGTELHDNQAFKLLGKANQFYVLLDNDYAGRQKFVKISEKLLSMNAKVNPVFPPYGDPSDWPRSEIKKWIENSISFTISSIYDLID